MTFTDKLADLGAKMLVCETNCQNRDVVTVVDVNTSRFNQFLKEAVSCGWKMSFHWKCRDRDGKMRTVAHFQTA